MPTTFPSISYSRVAMYPLERTNRFKTAVYRFLNDEEQRFVSQTPKQEFMLTYTGVDQSSYNTLRTFFQSVHGADINTFTLDLGTDPVTSVHMIYNNLVFVEDDFVATQSKPNRWDIKMRVRALS